MRSRHNPSAPAAIIALQTIKLAQGSNELRLTGIDLDSGRQVTINVIYDEPYRTTTPVLGCLLKLSLHGI